MREGATKFMKAAAPRDKQRKSLERIDVLGKMLKEISDFLRVSKSAISRTCSELISYGDSDPQDLLNSLNITEGVRFVQYTGDKVDVRHVLYNVQDTPLWPKFCELAGAQGTRQITLLVALKGGVCFVMTNKAITPAPGYFYHTITSGDPRYNNVCLFNLEYLPVFMKPEQIHIN